MAPVGSRARRTWGALPNLMILGNLDVERLPVFSFLVRHPTTGYYLHYNYVACLLNDLFGIQARGGCACAGPYAMVCVKCLCVCVFALVWVCVCLCV